MGSNMKTKAVRLYGEEDLRLEKFELPTIKDDEILAKVVSAAFACPHTRQPFWVPITNVFRLMWLRTRSSLVMSLVGNWLKSVQTGNISLKLD